MNLWFWITIGQTRIWQITIQNSGVNNNGTEKYLPLTWRDDNRPVCCTAASTLSGEIKRLNTMCYCHISRTKHRSWIWKSPGSSDGDPLLYFNKKKMWVCAFFYKFYRWRVHFWKLLTYLKGRFGSQATFQNVISSFGSSDDVITCRCTAHSRTYKYNEKQCFSFEIMLESVHSTSRGKILFNGITIEICPHCALLNISFLRIRTLTCLSFHW